MRYKTLPYKFATNVVKVRTKYKIPKPRKKVSISEEISESTFPDLAELIENKNNFLAELDFVAYKIYNLGEQGTGFRVKGDIQDYSKIRDECLRKQVLWEDPQFPANEKSLFYSKSPDQDFEWKRPAKIVDDPQFFVEGYSRFDVQQGELGDCWLLAAIINLTLNRRLFVQIVPDDQGFTDKYAGVFHFRFWQYGRWIDVVIDDRLPTYRGRLIYMHSTDKKEFWGALLEKAYAKLHGSYEALKGGSSSEAMEDFTGGIIETFELNNWPSNLFEILLKAYEKSSLISCSLDPDTNDIGKGTPEGLIRGHEYSITSVKFVAIDTNSKEKISLLRLHNPWGGEIEWKGPWSDQSPEWRLIPEHKKQEMGLTFSNDGEFWMSYNDFKTYFQYIEICNLNPDTLSKDELQKDNKKKWKMSTFEGEWVRGVTAGGCRNYLDTFWHNPQYRIRLINSDEAGAEEKCTVIINLMQKNKRKQRKMGMDNISIGCVVYHLPYPNRVPKPLDKQFFKFNSSIGHSPLFINRRTVTCQFKLSSGTYCIVPSSYEPNEEAEFLLRVYSENQHNMEGSDEKVSMIEKRACCDKSENVEDLTSVPDEQRDIDVYEEFFLKLAGEDMEVDWMELKDILDYTMRAERKEGFSKDICRSMVAMMDADFTGKLGFEEFKLLWVNVRNWKSIFKLYDHNGTNQLNAFELREALKSAGFKLNNHILNVLVHRYGSKDGFINLDDFIMCAVRLKTMFDLFRENVRDHTDKATVSLEEWLQKTVYS